MYEKTVDGTYVSSISKHWPYIVGIRSAQQRQAFSFNIKLDMHSYPIQKQTSVDFTFHWRNEMLELSQLTGMIHIETFRSTIVKLYDIWHIFWEHLMIMLTDLFFIQNNVNKHALIQLKAATCMFVDTVLNKNNRCHHFLTLKLHMENDSDFSCRCNEVR